METDILNKRLECQRRPAGFGCRGSMPGRKTNFSYPWLRSAEQRVWTPGTNDDREERRELEYWKQLYPSQVRRVQREVEHQCDLMDYDGSVIYDEYPDRMALSRICEAVYQALMNEGVRNDMEKYPAGMPVGRPAGGMGGAAMPETPSEDGGDMNQATQQEMAEQEPATVSGGYAESEDYIAPEEEEECAYDFSSESGLEIMQLSGGGRTLQDLIEVLLYNEIYHRRCCRRRQRSWYFG